MTTIMFIMFNLYSYAALFLSLSLSISLSCSWPMLIWKARDTGFGPIHWSNNFRLCFWSLVASYLFLLNTFLTSCYWNEIMKLKWTTFTEVLECWLQGIQSRSFWNTILSLLCLQWFFFLQFKTSTNECWKSVGNVLREIEKKKKN